MSTSLSQYTPAVRDQIAAYFKDKYGDAYQETIGDLESIEVGTDGLVCLAGGFVTQIVPD